MQPDSLQPNSAQRRARGTLEGQAAGRRPPEEAAAMTFKGAIEQHKMAVQLTAGARKEAPGGWRRSVSVAKLKSGRRQLCRSKQQVRQEHRPGTAATEARRSHASRIPHAMG